MEDRLTDRRYWTDYYSNPNIDKDRIISICSVYDEFWELCLKANAEQPPMSILEVGGYPGRYLAYLASKYNLIPTSIDFNPDKKKIEATMEVFGVHKFEIITGDFLLLTPHDKFDLVISNGFIEHFENYNLVMDNHVAYLKEGGTMLIMIPNKRWLRKWYGLLVDKHNLKMHNLDCMSKKTFIDFADRNNLTLLQFTYFGGFPYSYHQSLNWFQLLIFKVFRSIFKNLNPLIKKYPNPFLSSTILAVFKK